MFVISNKTYIFASSKVKNKLKTQLKNQRTMKKEFENKFESEVKKNITKIEEVINRTLEIQTKLELNKAEYSHAKGEIYFSLTEADGYTEIDKAFRNNKALCLLFSEVHLNVVCAYDDNAKAGYFRIEVEYTHTTHGSNGHELTAFWFFFETGLSKNVRLY